MNEYAAWYETLIKPFFAPPQWAFGVAWTIIYPLIAIALVYTWVLVKRGRVPHSLIWLFFLNMAGNLAFTWIQFGLRSNILAALDILLVVGTLALFELRIYKRSKIIFWLLMPYLLWGTFATLLQLSVTALNW